MHGAENGKVKRGVFRGGWAEAMRGATHAMFRGDVLRSKLRMRLECLFHCELFSRKMSGKSVEYVR
jgi:hypothetical protein